MDLKELLKKKLKGKDAPIDGTQKKAKLSVLEQLLAEADSAMGDGLKDLKKITVAAPTVEGLKEGLEKAKETVEPSEEAEEVEETDDNSEEEGEKEMVPETKSEDCSPEDREKKKAEFKQKLQNLMAGK